MNLTVEKKYNLAMDEREAQALRAMAVQFLQDGPAGRKIDFPESWTLAETLEVLLP